MPQKFLQPLKKRPISAITLRILAINLTAIVMLAVGILYVVQYQDDLIQAELDSMRAEAQLFAGAIAEGATRFRMEHAFEPYQSLSSTLIMPDLSRRMVRRFSEAKEIKVRLYNTLGDLVADSTKLTGPTGAIQISELEPPEEKEPMQDYFKGLSQKLLRIVPQRVNLPRHPDIQTKSALSFPDATSALQGIPSSTAWEAEDGTIMLSAAAPVQRVRRVMGVVYLTKSGDNIIEQVQMMQVEILKIFTIVFAMSIIFSFYLAGTMAGPLKRLAAAAEKIRKSKSRDIEIPNMSSRHDEIGELSMALRDMTESLWLRMDAVERFAADVSHELKNPLTSLRSAIETVQRIQDEESRKTLMNIIMHDVQRLDRLISDISKASRLDAELSKAELVDLDLYEVLNKLKEIHTVSRQGTVSKPEDIDVVFDLAQLRSAHVMGNETRLMQVFDNLVANALSFSPARGEIRIIGESRDDNWVIRVEDQGPGIPENKLETIFDRFYSERPDGEKYGNNSGLGLSIAKQIIDAHQGEIYAENMRDYEGEVLGARFIVQLPKI